MDMIAGRARLDELRVRGELLKMDLRDRKDETLKSLDHAFDPANVVSHEPGESAAEFLVGVELRQQLGEGPDRDERIPDRRLLLLLSVVEELVPRVHDQLRS